jgi:hypothetical protein
MNAATSETNALAYKNTAVTSATNAATSETNANTAASNAANSATSASTSATTATTQANLAIAAYDSFDDRYLGAKATVPTLDNDGNPLLTGAMFFDTTANKMKVYDGIVWQLAGSSVAGITEQQVYAATANQTTFSIVYDVGFVYIYLNGVRLTSSDFTATNGTSITLNTGCTAGDIVECVSFGTFEIANVYTKTENNTLLDLKATKAIALPTKVSATSINVDGTVLTVANPVAGKDYFFSKTAITTTKGADTIGGFHYGLIPTDFSAINNITTEEAEAIRGINANSIWTKWFRPVCDPSGMVYIKGKWYDIYLCNTDHHVNGTSSAGKTIAGGAVDKGRNYPKIPLQFGGNGTVTYGSMTWFEAAEIGKSHSKELIAYEEFVAITYGVLEASSAGSADTGITQHLANYTSKFGICMATGCEWIWGKDLHMRPDGSGWAWHTETEGRGGLLAYQYGPTAAIFGGALGDAGYSGSRASGWHYCVWDSGWSVGCRFAGDHLELA